MVSTSHRIGLLIFVGIAVLFTIALVWILNHSRTLPTPLPTSIETKNLPACTPNQVAINADGTRNCICNANLVWAEGVYTCVDSKG